MNGLKEIDNTSRTNINILKEELMQLPITFESEDYRSEIEKMMSSYIELLIQYNVSAEIISIIEEYKKTVIDIVNNYYLGQHNKSYSMFNKLCKDYFFNRSILVMEMTDEILYRARINTNDYAYSDNDMFHIPYNKRNLVTTQRYSFPGFPCLYFGLSPFVCWNELNRPSFDQMQVASYHYNKQNHIKIIDLSMSPIKLYKMLKEDIQSYYLEDYLYVWPFIALCTTKVIKEDGAFKPEYIFPQFFLQYIIENDNSIYGIKYLSIKSAQHNNMQYSANSKTYINYVFPTRSKEPNSYFLCNELIKQFELLNNYDGKELQVLVDAINSDGFRWGPKEKVDIIQNGESDDILYDSKGTRFDYNNTIFRRMEKILAVNEKWQSY